MQIYAGLYLLDNKVQKICYSVAANMQYAFLCTTMKREENNRGSIFLSFDHYVLIIAMQIVKSMREEKCTSCYKAPHNSYTFDDFQQSNQ